MKHSQSAPVKDPRPAVLPACVRERRAGLTGVRAGLVARVRAEIAAGTYETPERWAVALERLSADLR